MNIDAKTFNRVIALIAVVVIFIYGRSLWRGGEEVVEPEPPARPAKVLIVGANTARGTRVFPGEVQATTRAELAFEIAGKIVDLPVKEGEKVEKGAVIARIDDRDVKAKLESAEADYSATEKELNRQRNLFEQEVVAKSVVEKWEARFEAAVAALKTAKKAMGDTVIRAPFSGTIATRYKENHENVQAKEPVVSLQSLAAFEVEVQVPEQDIFRSNRGGEDAAGSLAVSFDAAPAARYPARLKELAAAADPTTRTYRASVAFDAPTDVTVLPGMTANVLWTPNAGAEKEETGVRVPGTVVLGTPEGKSYVWRVDPKDMSLRKVLVTIVAPSDDDLILEGGVAKGDMLLAAGVHYAREGMKIRPLGQEKDGGPGGEDAPGSTDPATPAPASEGATQTGGDA